MFHRRLPSWREPHWKDLELPGVVPGQSAMPFCCGHCWLPSSFLPVFTLLGSMSKINDNHHNNMRWHSSLVYMHSSNQDGCLHFNESTLVVATLWWSAIIDPALALYVEEGKTGRLKRLHQILVKTPTHQTPSLIFHRFFFQFCSAVT